MKGKDHFKELLGIQLIELKQGYAKTIMTIKKEHTNGLDVTHGGVIFSLADYAFAEAVNFGDNVALAVQVSINYLKPSKEGDTLTAEAVLVSEGKTFELYQVTVRKENKTIAIFTGLAYKPANLNNPPQITPIQKNKD
jgi:acyl-CoA thioesterase